MIIIWRINIQELLSHVFHVKTLLKFHWVDSQIIRGLTQHESENKYAHLK